MAISNLKLLATIGWRLIGRLYSEPIASRTWLITAGLEKPLTKAASRTCQKSLAKKALETLGETQFARDLQPASEKRSQPTKYRWYAQ